MPTPAPLLQLDPRPRYIPLAPNSPTSPRPSPLRSSAVSSPSPPLPSPSSVGSSTLHSPSPTRPSYDSGSIRPAFGPGKGSGSLSTPGYFDSDKKYARRSHESTMSGKFSLAPDPFEWGSNINALQAEPDDFLHNPKGKKDRSLYRTGSICTPRGLGNVGCLALLLLMILGLFVAYPVTQFLTTHALSNLGGFNLGGTNATGQVPSMPGNWGLIDLDTPKSAYKKSAWTTVNGQTKNMQLVFSDEFNEEGRSFYPGDDPYWEAEDIHYAATGNLEWYDPMAVTTANGALEITFDRKETHNLHFQGGMVTTWNKFCFTGGLIETAVILPGSNNVHGLWPAIWTMGNLGRAGYGATTEGMWPYTYDACDVGTAPNQTLNGLPLAAMTNGDRNANNELSWLPGQRLSRCTCPGESHPGPVHEDGTYVGRSAPEIDIFEAQITDDGGAVSQSGQFAPFNAHYQWDNTTDNLIIYDSTESQLNVYTGGALQQAASVVSMTNQDCYDQSGTGCFAVYGIEYKPGFDDSYITWINNNKKAWTLMGNGMAADTRVEISARPIPQEPMYIIMNLGMSEAFGAVDLEHLIFPTKMSVDYIRVYQDEDNINVGCDPTNFPTKAYIDQYIDAYTNFNLTTWKDDYKQPIPKSKFLGQC